MSPPRPRDGLFCARVSALCATLPSGLRVCPPLTGCRGAPPLPVAFPSRGQAGRAGRDGVTALPTGRPFLADPPRGRRGHVRVEETRGGGGGIGEGGRRRDWLPAPPHAGALVRSGGARARGGGPSTGKVSGGVHASGPWGTRGTAKRGPWAAFFVLVWGRARTPRGGEKKRGWAPTSRPQPGGQPRAGRNRGGEATTASTTTTHDGDGRGEGSDPPPTLQRRRSAGAPPPHLCRGGGLSPPRD